MPWANGGGTTWEVARHPPEPERAFSWRVSIAQIDRAGPFSPLPGIDRVFTLASHTPVELTINGHERPVHFAEPLRFSGEDKVLCATPEPATAVNVMTRKGAAAAEVRVHTTPTPELVIAPGLTALVVVLDGRLELAGRTLHPLQASAIGHGPVAMAGEFTALTIRIAG